MPINRVRFILENYVLTLLFIFTAAFFLGLHYFDSRVFLLLLNAFYIGQMVAIASSFGPYFIYIIFSYDPYTRARQYALTTGLQHLSYLLVVTYSITARRYGGYGAVAVDWQLLLSRYVILIAGFLQLMAPDLGRPLLYGMSRKALWAGSIVGMVTAGGVLWLQFWPSHIAIQNFFDLLEFGR